MNFLTQRVPDYMRAKYQIIGTVTFTAFFSLVFMLISIPFSHNAWFQIGPSEAFAFTSAFYFIALLSIILSRRVMYATRNDFTMNFLQYIIWSVGEALLVSLLYTVFSIIGNHFGIINLAQSNAIVLFLNASVYCISSIILPYIIAGMYFAIIDKNNTIRMMNYSNVVTDEPVPPQEGQKVTLFDNSGVLKMSINLANIWYIESDDNYVVVWYDDSNGELKNYMVRCRLKTIEESFKGTALARCHRKYIVNMNRIKMLRKEKEGYEIDMDNPVIPPITVTKTYSERILNYFSSQPATDRPVMR